MPGTKKSAQDREYQEHSEDHQGHGDGGDEQDAPAQDRMRAARPYAEKIRKIIGHLRQVNLDYKHPFTLERPVKPSASS